MMNLASRPRCSILTLPLTLTLLAASSLAACSGVDDPGVLPEESGVIAVAADDSKADQSSVSFSVITDSNNTKHTAARKTFTTRSAFKTYFGHDAPAAVDFSKEWVVYYNAGTRATGGYAASIDSIRDVSGTLRVTTALSSPGTGCIVNQLVTYPSVMVKLARQGSVTVQYRAHDTARDCSMPSCPPNTKFCMQGHHYDGTPGVCGCVPDACPPNTKACLGGHHYDGTPGVCGCVPDACAPNTKFCTLGHHYDGTPGVCGCVPDACAPNTKACLVGNHYDGTPGVCTCVPDGTCHSDADCRLEDDYCTGCDCRALATHQSLSSCAGPGVRCLREPCGGLTARCEASRCVAR